jgi:hypothetical protein
MRAVGRKTPVMKESDEEMGRGGAGRTVMAIGSVIAVKSRAAGWFTVCVQVMAAEFSVYVTAFILKCLTDPAVSPSREDRVEVRVSWIPGAGKMAYHILHTI